MSSLSGWPVRVLRKDEKHEGHKISPSQITTYLECPRKWAWAKIAKIRVPPHPSAALGTRCHSALERYLSTGERPDAVSDREVATIISAGLHFLPDPASPGMTQEQQFEFQSLETGFVYWGLKDVSLPVGVSVPTLGFDGDLAVVMDHKTTSNINKYGKKSEHLHYDPQAAIYALDTMVREDVQAVNLAWIYYQTKAPYRAEATIATATRRHTLRVFTAIESVAMEMMEALNQGKNPEDLRANTSACAMYGGCPYQNICPRTVAEKVQSKMSNPLIDNLFNRVQGQDAPVTTIVEVTEEETPVALNPPESQIPFSFTAVEPTAPAPAQDEVPKKRGRQKRTEATPVDAPVPYSPVASEPKGFTLYVDCFPLGRPAQALSKLIEAAQEKISADHGVPDYRLIDYGKGAPCLVQHVVSQVDGTFDILLDSRTPEGNILLEPLSSAAGQVVRGFR